MKRIAILAGGGTLPLVLADSIVDRGGQAHIVAVRGEAGPAVEAYPHTWVTWGAVNAIIAGDGPAMPGIAHAIGRIGHSSGWDAAAGAALVLGMLRTSTQSI